MSPQSNESSLLAEPNMPFNTNIYFRRPGEDMENRLAHPKSLDSALRNAAGFDEEQFKMLKDVLVQTARKHLDLSLRLKDQNREQWQAFVNEVWESKLLEVLLENYDEQWPMMVYMSKYLACTSKNGRRKHKKKQESTAEVPTDGKADEDRTPDVNISIRGNGGISQASNDVVDTSSSAAESTKQVNESVSVSGVLVKAKEAKENVTSEEGHRIQPKLSGPVRISRRSHRRWTPVVEIPIKRKSTQSSDRVPLVRAEAIPVDPQPMSLIPPVSAHVPVKQFLESCDANLEELLPLFIDAGIKDESSLMALVLCPRRDRLSFLRENFIDRMTLEQILIFNEDCELQSRYFA